MTPGDEPQAGEEEGGSRVDRAQVHLGVDAEQQSEKEAGYTGSRREATPGGDDEQPENDAEFSLYSLPTPVSGSLRIRLPDSVGILAARDDRNASAAFVTSSGDPVVRVYCEVKDPQSFRFRQRFSPFHADFLSYGRVLAWISAMAALGWGLVLFTIVTLVFALWRWIDA